MIDIGANLAHESFSHDLPQVLQRAWDAGLEAIVVTGSSRTSNTAAAALCTLAPGRLFSTAGLHPHHANEWGPEDAALIRELAQLPQLVSLGECGLDYFRDLAPRADQRRAFSAQLALAAELGKPVFLHQRDAHTDFLPILREYRPQLKNVCVHCFTDNGEAMADYLALGCHIGITGWVCDERRGGPLRALIPQLPMAALMIETDAPYLLPHNLPKGLAPLRSRRNEPGLLPYVAQALATLYDCTAAELGKATAENSRRFFALPAQAA